MRRLSLQDLENNNYEIDLDYVKSENDYIGQEKAYRAFVFGLGVNKPGYNVFVTGSVGTGRRTFSKNICKEFNRKNGKVILHDIIYVNNFENDDAMLIRPLAGEGRRFKKQFGDVMNSALVDIQSKYETPNELNGYYDKFQEVKKGLFH